MQSLDMQSLKRAFEKNLPTILTGAAVVGVIGTVVLAVRATPKAMLEIKRAQEDVYEPDKTLIEGDERLKANFANWTILKSVQACWRCYIPAGLTGTATIACIIGANVIGLRRNAALLAAYTLADTSFREYKDKVLEHVTPQKAQKIDDEIMADKIEKDAPKAETVVFTDGGDILCYESLTGRCFKSSAEKIKRAAQDVDARILQGEMYAPLNEFFKELGLEPTDLGRILGFNVECRLKVVLSSHLVEGVFEKPALAIGYEKLPVFQFDSF
jgi:Family of unknown function (DUF6353)